jgi:lycopene cyclase-like protein
MQVRVRARHEVERCRIPMGMPLPIGSVAAFGSAAGFIHPATGYSLATSLRLAEPAARAIAEALGSGGSGEATAALHAACWPEDRARAWAFYRFGMEAFLRMDLARTREFFDSFFQHSPSVWGGWLAGELPPVDIAVAMLAHFGRVGWRVRGQLVATSLGPQGWQLARELLTTPTTRS